MTDNDIAILQIVDGIETAFDSTGFPLEALVGSQENDAVWSLLSELIAILGRGMDMDDEEKADVAEDGNHWAREYLTDEPHMYAFDD